MGACRFWDGRTEGEASVPGVFSRFDELQKSLLLQAFKGELTGAIDSGKHFFGFCPLSILNCKLIMKDVVELLKLLTSIINSSKRRISK